LLTAGLDYFFELLQTSEGHFRQTPTCDDIAYPKAVGFSNVIGNQNTENPFLITHIKHTAWPIQNTFYVYLDPGCHRTVGPPFLYRPIALILRREQCPEGVDVGTHYLEPVPPSVQTDCPLRGEVREAGTGALLTPKQDYQIAGYTPCDTCFMANPTCADLDSAVAGPKLGGDWNVENPFTLTSLGTMGAPPDVFRFYLDFACKVQGTGDRRFSAPPVAVEIAKDQCSAGRDLGVIALTPQ
jgi:hypothetical protein